ncbi:MAG: NADPH-dependent FMN reductase [Canibacter sp.]
MSTVAVVVGNPKPQSRTREVAELLGQGIAEVVGATRTPTIELVDFASSLFRWPAEDIDEALAAVANADIAVFATPTYKASYSGLLKSFLDRYDNKGLSTVTAVGLFTQAAPQHTLAAEFTLRPLLVELGASVPTKSLVFPSNEHERRNEIVSRWLSTQSSLFHAAAQKGRSV